MLSHVYRQIAAVREFLRAHLALVWLLSRVDAHVDGQSAGIRECLLAHLAFEGFFA